MACVKCKQEIVKLLGEQNRLLRDLIQRFDIGEDVDQEYCDIVRDIDMYSVYSSSTTCIYIIYALGIVQLAV